MMVNKIDTGLKSHIAIVYICLIVITFAIFWQGNQFDFVNIDDDIYVTNNIHVQSGISLDSLNWAFSTTHAQFWHPLTWLSLMLDYQIYGLNPGGYHLTNLILHILSTLLLFRIFHRMTGSIWRSTFVAAFFALHPLRVESVVWVAERKDVLSGFFWMLTLCQYVYYTGNPTIKRYLPVLFYFACGLMSKPMVVTLPAVMILLDYWPLGRFSSQKGNVIFWQLKEKSPFFILSAIFSLVTLYAQYNPFIRHFPWGHRLANAPVAVLTYLEKIFWPFDLAILYPISEHIPPWQIVFSAVIIILIFTAVIWKRKRQPYLFVGWLWYFITLLPVIGLTQTGPHTIHDLYTYLPSVGITVGLVWGIPLLFKSERLRRYILLPAGITAVIILSVLTWRQCGYWQNSITLLERDLQVTNGRIALAHNNIGVALAEAGRMGEAIGHYNEAIRLKPDYPDAYNNRGSFYGILGQYELAVENFNKAIALKFDYAKAYYNRGTAYAYLGRYKLAIDDYNEAIRLKPNYADALNNRAVAYLKQGNVKIGCEEARKICARGHCAIWEAARIQGYCR